MAGGEHGEDLKKTSVRDERKSENNNPGRSRGTVGTDMHITRSQQCHSTRQNFAQAKRRRGRTKPKISANYIVGLTDGEGCFYALIKPPFNRNGGGIVQLSFFLKLREEDQGVLHDVRDALGCGSVYFQHETRANHAQCYRYTVSSHRDVIGRIIPFFQNHPLHTATKRASFRTFCAIAMLVKQGAHHTAKGIANIKMLKQQMNHRTRVVREIRSLRGNAK